MILGAGTFQLPAIRKAVDLGYHVITVDYLPDNVGHKISHQYVNCSTTDRKGVLQAAKKLQVDGICTFSSDVAIPTVSYVCESLGLPGASTTAAEIMAIKNLFRVFQQQQGFECPGFMKATGFNEIEKNIENLKFPVIFKPVDTSGSRGLVRIESLDLHRVQQAFDYARGFSRSGTVCIEELVEGTHHSGDGILVNGRFGFIAITDKLQRKFISTGHLLPTQISPEEQQRIITALEACCQSLGYRNGPLNFDVVMAGEKVTIIEMSPRNGGNGIPAIIKRATGIDLEIATLQLALGDKIELSPKKARYRGCGSFMFGSDQTGKLSHLSPRETVLKEMPQVFELYLNYQIGDRVFSFEHSGNMLGYVLLDCENREDYARLTAQILKALQIDITETQ